MNFFVIDSLKSDIESNPLLTREEEFNLSKEEADNLIMNARKIVFAD